MSDTALRKARRRANLTQLQLAELSGVPQSQISRLEAGYVRDPGYRLLQRLVSALRTRKGMSSLTVDSLAPPDHGAVLASANRIDEAGQGRSRQI